MPSKLKKAPAKASPKKSPAKSAPSRKAEAKPRKAAAPKPVPAKESPAKKPEKKAAAPAPAPAPAPAVKKGAGDAKAHAAEPGRAPAPAVKPPPPAPALPPLRGAAAPAVAPPADAPRPIVPQFIDETPHHKVGEFVVYPGVGVCEILSIESKKFADSDRKFYFLRVLSDRARIFLPVANAPRVGLRAVISMKESNAVFTVLKNQVNKRIKDWKKRQALITEKVHSGDPLKAAEVYKRLYFLSKTKGLSHGENVAFVKVRTILADELSIISGSTKEQMIQKIDKILEASYKKRGDMEIDEDEE